MSLPMEPELGEHRGEGTREASLGSPFHQHCDGVGRCPTWRLHCLSQATGPWAFGNLEHSQSGLPSLWDSIAAHVGIKPTFSSREFPQRERFLLVVLGMDPRTSSTGDKYPSPTQENSALGYEEVREQAITMLSGEQQTNRTPLMVAREGPAHLNGGILCTMENV